MRFFHYSRPQAGAEDVAEPACLLHEAFLQQGYPSFLIDPTAAAAAAIRFAADDLLFLHDTGGDAGMEGLLRLPIRKVFVHHTVEADVSEPRRRWLTRLSRNVQLAVAGADGPRRALVARGFRNTVAIPPVYEDGLFRSPALDLPYYLDLKENASINLVCGDDLRPEQDVELVIDAAAEYARLFRRPVLLHLAGRVANTEYAAALMQRASGKRMFGALRPVTELAPLRFKTLLAAADALLSCGKTGGFDISVAKAFTAGCPVIARRAGSVSPTSGAGFILAEPEPSLIAGLIELLRRDKQTRTDLLREQFRVAIQFRSDRTIHRWLHVLRRVFDLQPARS